MTNLIQAISVGAATGATDVAAQIAQHQSPGLSTALTIAAFSTCLVLWMSNKFEKRDRADAIYREHWNRRLDDFEDQLSKLSSGAKENGSCI